MEKVLSEILEKVNSIDEKISDMEKDLKYYGERLERLEKMDSIEHRVTVNQIDLTDIKGIVENVSDFQREELKDLSRFINNYLKDFPVREEINLIHKRLDVQLNMIAKNEEALLIVGNKN
ncbi:hypothetical protein [Neobacillus sp. PS3-40]|uniref:hypothetical protein n=1 Tax=Neobacillus sp. PS3-40 TaxID=3070679 RepID=UPI0027E1CE16|nr:hypothetical protein [Neobacillus sp. PS3-40]WML44893.1 hypothetical protein RCG20_03010 [Neobacillus sp. PS3-40]